MGVASVLHFQTRLKNTESRDALHHSPDHRTRRLLEASAHRNRRSRHLLSDGFVGPASETVNSQTIPQTQSGHEGDRQNGYC